MSIKKLLILLGTLIVVAVVIAACGPSETPAPSSNRGPG